MVFVAVNDASCETLSPRVRLHLEAQAEYDAQRARIAWQDERPGMTDADEARVQAIVDALSEQ